MAHKPDDALLTATADECLRDALRFALAGPATWRPDDSETVAAARKRFALLGYSSRLDMISRASRIVCLALWQDLSSAQPKTRVVEA